MQPQFLKRAEAIGVDSNRLAQLSKLCRSLVDLHIDIGKFARRDCRSKASDS